MILLAKNQNISISAHLKSDEFKCNCDQCLTTIIHPDWLQAWSRLRLKANSPIRILSGYRCQNHNTNIGGAEQSRHITGQAADFNLNDLLTAFKNTTIIRKVLFECGFTYIEINEEHGYVHADTRGKL